MNDYRHTRLDRYRAAADGHVQPAAHRPAASAPQSTKRFSLTCGVVAIAAMATLFAAFPPDGDTRWVLLAAAVPVLSVSARIAYRSVRSMPSTRARLLTIAGAVIVVGFFGVGLRSQLTIDGRPMLATSQQARSHDVVAALYGDLIELGVHDELLGIDQADARSRYNSYEPAARAMRAIANRWSRTDLGALPDPDLIEVVQHIKTAATFGAEALDMRYQLITEPDDRLAAAVSENRTVFIAEALAAGAKLQPLAERYRVETFPAGVAE